MKEEYPKYFCQLIDNPVGYFEIISRDEVYRVIEGKREKLLHPDDYSFFLEDSKCFRKVSFLELAFLL